MRWDMGYNLRIKVIQHLAIGKPDKVPSEDLDVSLHIQGACWYDILMLW